MTVSPTRVVIYGIGAMGSLMARLIHQRGNAVVVGAIDHDPVKIGRDVGELIGLDERLGIQVQWPAKEALAGMEADVVLLAITAFAEEALPALKACIAECMSVVTIVQELFYPLGERIPIARQIDMLAREAGVAVTSVGINPGFILDIIPSVGSVACWQVESVTGRRNVNFSPYGPDEMAHIGANLTPEEFRHGVNAGKVGHIGLLESVAFTAHCCGIPIDELRQTKEPLIADKLLKTDYAEVAPGRVRGFTQRVKAYRNSVEVMDFQMIGVLAPWEDPDEFQLGDYLRINGTPSVDIRIKEEISQKGGLGTAAVAVNMIAKILVAPPGLHAMNQLALPYLWSEQVSAAEQIVISGS